ncbi:MAG TPA: histidine phosphatase family protein [Patescibacteria group bacterium]|nr:histidine phosphatase family protein [Patescibacteria group bacterium]
MKIYVIRHGLTPLNKKRILNAQLDEFLTPEGIKQAQASIAIIPKSVKHIYTSSLIRTKQTAKIINEKLNLPISEHDELREIHMGSLAGMSWDDFGPGEELKIKHRSIKFDYRNRGGESSSEFKKRVTSFLKQIAGKHKDGEALIVTHGGIVRLLYLLEHSKELTGEIANASIHTVDLSKVLRNPDD